MAWALLALVVVLGLVYVWESNRRKLSDKSQMSNLNSTLELNHGYKLFEGNFSDTKYGFSFKLPDYFGRYGGWESDNDWERGVNPDHLLIIPLETAKHEDVVFKQIELLKEVEVSVSKGTTINSWSGKTKTIPNSQADGWGIDHKFITKKMLNPPGGKLVVLKFTYLDQVLMPENPQAGDEYDETQPVTGVAVQLGKDVVVISMKHGVDNQAEVDNIFTQIISTFRVNK